MSKPAYDVAIIGGGPAGTTVGSFLRKYHPEFKVLILEREVFPRDHIGESQLPYISYVLNELGVWDKVEAADFPVKVGATYRWGNSNDLWDFEFVPFKEYVDVPRPAKFEGQRTRTAFQVDRAIYDKILLDHSRELGCEVRENTKVVKINHENDVVTGLQLDTGEEITARYYVDASGHSGIMRRALGIPVDIPTSLMNIAIWDYWQNADWAVHIGVSGTRIQVLSLGYGWLWFIPLGPTRTSLGFVTHVEYYKRSGKRPEEIYKEAIEAEPRVKALLRNATSEGKLTTTKDWSFISERMMGDNWFIVGEAAGFADPILSAGLTLAHTGGREVAFSILELDRGTHGKNWLREQYEHRQKRRVRQHIKFADYWYTANAHFSDLVEFTSEIAESVGLELEPEKAWQWLGTGGFVDEDLGIAALGGYSLGAAKHITNLVGGMPVTWKVAQNNVFRLNKAGAKESLRASYQDGRVLKVPSLERGNKILPLIGHFGFMVQMLEKAETLPDLLNLIGQHVGRDANGQPERTELIQCVMALEAMALDDWIECKYYKKLPLLDMPTEDESGALHVNEDIIKMPEEMAEA